MSEIVWGPQEPVSQQPSLELTAASVVAAFNSLPYSAQSAVLDVLERLVAKRFNDLTKWAQKQPQRTIPLHDPKEAQRLARVLEEREK